MPIPTSQLHVDAILSNVSVKYTNDELIADAIFPPVIVDKRSNKFFTYTKKDVYTVFDPTMGPKDRAPRIDWSVGTDNYSVDDFGFEDIVANSDDRNADAPLDLQIDTTITLTERILLFKERQVANIAFASGTYGSSNKATPGVKWGNPASAGTSSDPVLMILTAIDALYGVGPFYIAFGQRAWLNFRQHPSVLAAIQFSSGGVAVDKGQVATFFEAAGVYVGKARINTANRGATQSDSRIWDDHVLIYRRADRPGLRQVSLGYQMVYSPLQTYRWEEPQSGVEGGTGLRVSGSWDVKTVAADAGYLIYDVID